MAIRTHGCSTRNNTFGGNSDSKVAETSSKYRLLLNTNYYFKVNGKIHSRKSIKKNKSGKKEVEKMFKKYVFTKEGAFAHTF